MGKFIDLTGQTYGRLTVKERADNRNGRVCWLCECECGKERIVRGSHLTSGCAKSCGCLSRELRTTHGGANGSTYHEWYGIKARCFNPCATSYDTYGARGITMYEPWINDPVAFENYVSQLEHFNEEGYTLDRINNDGNYEPGNLRFATQSEQNRNTRRNVWIEYNGELMTLIEASEKSGISYATLKGRYRAGDRGDRLFRPVKK